MSEDSAADSFTCRECQRKLGRSAFSKTQLRKADGSWRCRSCITGQPGVDSSPAVAERERPVAKRERLDDSEISSTGEGLTCRECLRMLDRSAFSITQLKKASGLSRCKSCIAGVADAETPSAETEQREPVAKRQRRDENKLSSAAEGLTCCNCQRTLDRSAFSNNQLRKAPDFPRCKSCIDNVPEDPICHRTRLRTEPSPKEVPSEDAAASLCRRLNTWDEDTMRRLLGPADVGEKLTESVMQRRPYDASTIAALGRQLQECKGIGEERASKVLIALQQQGQRKDRRKHGSKADKLLDRALLK